MRAPVLVFPRTRTPSQGRGYLDAGAAGSPEAFGLGIAKGAGSVGAGLTDMAAVWQDRLDKTERFNALNGLSDLKVNTAVQLEELKRSVDPGVTDFVQQAQEVVRKAEQGYLTKVPPHLQPEMTYKLGEMKRSLLVDSMNFQYTQSDANFNAGLAKQYTRAQVAVSQDPSKYDVEIKSLFDLLQASDLPAPEKLKLGQDMQAGLSAVKYGKEYENRKRNPLAGVVLNRHEAATYQRAADVQQKLVNRGFTPVQAAAVAGRWIQESGVQSAGPAGDAGISHGLAQWNKERLEMLKSDVWRRPRDVGKDWQDADLQLEFFLWELANTEQAAGQRLRNATTPEEAAEAMMDYERPEGWSVGNSRGGHGWENTINATLRLSGAEATMALDLDPTYRNLPLEARIAIQHDADQKVQQDINAQIKARQAGEEAGRNTLYRNLMDGTAGETDIMAADKAGYLDDAAHYAQAQKLLADRQGEVDETAVIQSTLDNNGQGYNRVTMNGTKDKGVNAWVGQKGLDRITARDDAYMDGELLPAVGKWDDIPTVVVGQLESMASSNDTATAVWALQRLQEMKDIAPNGFVSRTTENRLSERVESFRNLRGLFETDKEMLSYVNGGTTPEAQRIMKARDADARTALTKLSSKEFLNKIDPAWFGSYLSQDYEVSGALEVAGRELYVMNFRMTGDETKALNMTKRMLNEKWGISAVGDSTEKVVMEWPPEIVYKNTKVPMEVYQDQIRRAFNLTDDEGYRLIADETTYREIAAAGRGQLLGPDGQPRLPSYRVKRITKNANAVDEGRWFGDPVAPVEETE